MKKQQMLEKIFFLKKCLALILVSQSMILLKNQKGQLEFSKLLWGGF